jgi:hypothetical protein
MTFDVSSAEQLVHDFLRMAEDYREHDPELSKELKAKAGEISHDLGLDIGLGTVEAVTVEPYQKAFAAISTKGHDRVIEVGRSEPDPESFEDEDQLLQILDRQRTIVEAQTEENTPRSAERSRSKSQGWGIFGSWLRPQSV